MADVLSSEPLHSIQTILSNKPVQLPKPMVEAHVTDSLAHFIATEGTLLKNNPEAVVTVHCIPSVDRDT